MSSYSQMTVDEDRTFDLDNVGEQGWKSDRWLNPL